MEKYYVYSLVDPRDNAVKYIGVTINPKARLCSHINTMDGAKLKLNWIKGLRNENLKPTMEILEECDSSELAAERERYFYDLHNNGQLVCGNPYKSRYAFYIGRPKPTREYPHEHVAQYYREKAAALGITAAKS